MANKIIHKHSSAIDNSGSVSKAKLPTNNQLEFGEIALNYAKGYETISFKNNSNEIVEFKDKLYIDNVYDELAQYINDLSDVVDGLENVVNDNDSATTIAINDINDKVENINNITIASSYDELSEISAKTGSIGIVVSTTDTIQFEDIYQATFENDFTENDGIKEETFNKLTRINKINFNIPTSNETFDAMSGFLIVSKTSETVLGVVLYGENENYIGLSVTNIITEENFAIWEITTDSNTVYEDNIKFINELIGNNEEWYVLNVIEEIGFGFVTDIDLFKDYISFEKNGFNKQELYLNNGINWEEFNSGVSVINNLTDGGIDKALSAEMGKILNEKISVEPIRYKGYVSIDDKTDIDRIFDELKVNETCLCVPSSMQYGQEEHSYLPWVMTALNSDYMYIDESLLSIDKSQFTLGNIANLIAGKGEIRTYFKLDEEHNYIQCPDLLLLAKVKVNLKDFLEATDGVSDTILSLIPDKTEMTACIGKVMRWSTGDVFLKEFIPELGNVLDEIYSALATFEESISNQDTILNENLPYTKYGYNDYNPDLNLKTGVNNYYSNTINGITANWTLFVNSSADADGGGYYHLTQTAVCRDNPYAGRMWKRFGYYKPGVETKFMEWYEITGTNSAINDSNVNLDEVYNKISELENTVDEGQYVCAKAITELNSRTGVYAEVNHGTSDTVFTLTPNTFHIWDEVSTLELSLGEKVEGITNEYLFQFSSGTVATTLNIHGNIKWADIPNMSANKTYQISILNGLGNIIEYSNV